MRIYNLWELFHAWKNRFSYQCDITESLGNNGILNALVLIFRQYSTTNCPGSHVMLSQTLA